MVQLPRRRLPRPHHTLQLRPLGDCLTVMVFPPDHRRRLGGTNMLESLMKVLRKRTAVVGVFPSRSSCDRLVGAQLLEVHGRWLGEPVATFNMDLAAAHPAGRGDGRRIGRSGRAGGITERMLHYWCMAEVGSVGGGL